MMGPGMVSLTNLQNQTTLLLPGAEFPSIQDIGNSVGNNTINNKDNNIVINQTPKITGLTISNNNKLCTNTSDDTDKQKINESGS